MIQAGTIDNSFSIGSGFNDMVYITKLQPDGKILVGGNFTDFNGNATYYLTRLNSDGSLDNTFNNGSHLDDVVKAIEILPDGRIAVGGQFNFFDGNLTYNFVILNSDGSVNQLFPLGTNGNWVRVIKVQPNGKILVGGDFTSFNGDSYSKIVRLNSNGSIDPTFSIGGGFDASVYSIELKSNGNILVGGDFSQYNSLTSNRIVEIDSTGTLLNSFGIGFDDRVQKIILQSDGKILVGGRFNTFNGNSSDYMIRLTATGLLDTTFFFNGMVVDMMVQSDGRIVVVGKFTDFNGDGSNYIIRLNQSGTIDGSFYTGSGFDNSDGELCISLLQSGSLLIGGWAQNYDNTQINYLVALNNDEQSYQYPYVYEAIGCDLSFGVVSPLNIPTYYVGSNVELSNGNVVSLYDKNNPSRVQCATITSHTNIFAEPTHVHITTYNHVEECLSAITSISIVKPCNDDNISSQFPIYVSNLYKVGDIITIPHLIYNDGFGDWVYYYNNCYEILDLQPFSISESLPQPYIVNYEPKVSYENCISCLGKYYEYYNCDAPINGVLLSHQDFQNIDTVYFNNGCSSVVSIDDSNIQPIPLALYEEYFTDAPVVTSTITFNGDYSCQKCENALGNGLVWQNQINGDGVINFLNQYEVDILGPNDDDNDGWSYIKVQMPVDGSITFNYSFITDDDVDHDWGFYYVGNEEPYDDNNIDFNSDKFTFNAVDSGEITINFSAGQWVSIGVYSDDSCCGSGLLNLLFEPFNLYTHNSYDFVSCSGEVGSVLLPLSARTQFHNITKIPYVEITNVGLDAMNINDRDDDYIEIPLPTDYSVDFLCKNYNTVFLSTNGYLTFSGGSTECCFQIPNGIPATVGLPGIYLSTAYGESDITDGMDDWLFDWYSGTTDGGSKFIVRFEGTYLEYELDFSPPPLIFSFVFYSGVSEYFDLVIQDNTVFYDNNPTGGLSDGMNGGWIKSFNSGSQRSYRISSNCPLFKTNYGTQELICGTIGDVLPTGGGSAGGSMYFDGDTILESRVEVTNNGDFQFGPGNDFTIEWFQYWEGDNSAARPFSIGTYPYDLYMEISFEGNGYFWVGDGIGGYQNPPYDLGIDLNSITNTWVHFAITRLWDGSNHIYRVFLNGNMVLEQIDNTYALQFTSLPLIIGGQSNNDGLFKGNITNFRVNNLTALYLAPFTVPPCPLTSDANTVLLLLANDNTNLLLDSSSSNQTVTENGNITWSELTPCSPTPVNLGQLFSEASLTYENCNDCKRMYGATIRECSTGEVLYVKMDEQDVNNILANGPIFGTIGVECYEMLDYCILPNTNLYHPYLFYPNCEICNQPFSANTETPMYVNDWTGDIIPVLPPHPQWVNNYGKTVVQLNMVQLGGTNGLNS